MCVKQAEIFHAHMKINQPLNASSSWLNRFKKQHGIHQLAISGEKLSRNEEADFCY